MTGLTIGRPLAEMISLTVVGCAISAALPTFWNLPTAYLGAGTAAAGIAAINSIGNISGYLAPQLVGLLRDKTGTYAVSRCWSWAPWSWWPPLCCRSPPPTPHAD